MSDLRSGESHHSPIDMHGMPGVSSGQEEKLRSFFQTYTDREVADAFGIELTIVRQIRERLNISAPK